MHVAIPFYMDTITNSFGRPERMWGRAVANHGFVRALASAPAPHRLTLFVPTRKDAGILEQTLLRDLPRPVTVVPFARIGPQLAADPIDVLHVLDPNLWIGAHIRRTLAPSPFVVTGMTHSLANEHFLNWALLNSANGVHPGDCLVCTSPTAEGVLRSAFARLAAVQPDFAAPGTAVLPLGVALDDPGTPTSLRRVELGLDDGDFVILSFARFNPEFKMDLVPLLNMVELLAPRVDRPVRLVLAGAADNGAYARFIQDRVKERGLATAVRCVLDTSDRDRLGLHRLADVFLSLSDNLQETFGLTVVEALAAGLPVVASDWDGYRSLVQDGVTGYLVPTRTLPADPAWESVLAIQRDSLAHLSCAQTTAVDLVAAADRLARLAADRALARRMGSAAAAAARALAWEQVLPRYLALWARLAEAARAAPVATTARSSALGFLGDFAGYATRQLGPDDRFVTSPLGQALLAGKATANIYDHLDEFLDFSLMQQLLQLCRAERPVGDLLERLAKEPQPGALKVRQNLLWLYKYGFLEARAGLPAMGGLP